jgi:transposase
MEQRTKRTQRDYSLAFKLSVVEQVEKGELTYKEAQRRYGIQGRSTVLVWLRKHGLQDWSPRSGCARSSVAMPNQDSRPLTPEQRIKELETQLREAQEKSALFEAVIEIMRKEHGITVKKPSGRPSRKSTSRG